MKKFMVMFTVIMTSMVVLCGCSSGEKMQQAIQTSTATLGEPNILITNREEDVATIQIQMVEGADGYKIYRSLEEEDNFTLIGSTTSDVYTDQMIDSQKAYKYKVCAYVVDGEQTLLSKESNIVSVKAGLNMPAELKGSEVRNGKVTIHFSEVENATEYKIYRATDLSKTYEYIGSAGTNIYTDTGLKEETTYYYIVRAYRLEDLVEYNGKCSDVLAVNSKDGVKVISKEQMEQYIKELEKQKNQDQQEETVAPENTPTPTVTQSPVVTETPEQEETTKLEPTVVPDSTQEGSSDAEEEVVDKVEVTSTPVTQTEKYASQVVNLINNEREKQGVTDLKQSSLLTKAANLRAEEIVTTFSHTRPDGSGADTVLGEYSISYMAWGENIAYGQPSAEAVMNAWMNSSGHRANILNSNFGTVGIGCYENNGLLYWVQIFKD